MAFTIVWPRLTLRQMMKLIINHTSLLENITKGGDNVMLVEGHPD